MLMKVLELNLPVTSENDREADLLREEMRRKGTLLINLMSSPGAGKTTLLSALIRALPEYRIAVLEADIASSVDAEHIEAFGAEAVQVHTGGMCHMDAQMTAEAVHAVSVKNPDLLFLENVGNLICPAEYDTGAGRNIMLLSVPEGDDKPLKYPLMFEKSDALIITKTDTLPYFTFDLEKCAGRARKLNPGIRIFPVSAKTGEGMEALTAWLRSEAAAWKQK